MYYERYQDTLNGVNRFEAGEGSGRVRLSPTRLLHQCIAGLRLEAKSLHIHMTHTRDFQRLPSIRVPHNPGRYSGSKTKESLVVPLRLPAADLSSTVSHL